VTMQVAILFVYGVTEKIGEVSCETNHGFRVDAVVGAASSKPGVRRLNKS